MSDPASDLDALAAKLADVLAHYDEIAAAWVFGSAARGALGPTSDVDVGLVFRRRGDGALQHHRMIGDLTSRLEGVTAPRPVDVVVLEDQGPMFCHRVLLEGRLVYEADRERRVDFESETVTRALDFRPTWKIAAEGQIDGFRRWLAEYRS